MGMARGWNTVLNFLYNVRLCAIGYLTYILPFEYALRLLEHQLGMHRINWWEIHPDLDERFRKRVLTPV